MRRQIPWLVAGALTVLAVAALAAFWPAPAPSVPLDARWEVLEQSLGRASAPVTVIAYLDFACPHCATFAREVQPWLVERYVQTGQVRFIYRPAPFLGEASVQAHAAAACVAEQGSDRFWRFYHQLFALAGRLPWWRPDPVYARLAAEAGADPTALAECLASGRYAQAMRGALALARADGVPGTPTLRIGSEILVGVPSLVTLEGKLKEALRSR